MKVRTLYTTDAGFEAAFAKLVAVDTAVDKTIEARADAIVDDVRSRGDAALLEYTDCCGAAEKLIQFQREGGSSREGYDIMNPPEDVQRANDMWDSILKRNIADFF